MSRRIWPITLLLVSCCSLHAQDSARAFEGMWSDPPIAPVDFFCTGACTDAGIERLNALLDDPANDDRPYLELLGEASAYQINTYLLPRLTTAALETYPLDPLKDPGFVDCQPWGIARQLLARHQLEIRDEGDRIEMRYGEWTAHRTVYMDGREPPQDQAPTRMGFSVGRYESDALVVETTGIGADIMSQPGPFKHSERLRIVERYTVSDDRQRLFLTATYDDPRSLKEPLVIKKIWGWAPDQQIYPLDCERPTESSRQEDQP